MDTDRIGKGIRILIPLSVLFGGEARIFPEDFGEVALVAEAAGYADLHDGIIGVFQQMLCFPDPHLIQIILERTAGDLPEQGGKIGGIEVDGFGDVCQRNLL